MSKRLPTIRPLMLMSLAAALLPALCLSAQAGKTAPVSRLPVDILGVRPGMDVDDARTLLQKQAAPAALDSRSSESEADAPDRDTDKPSASQKEKSAPKMKASDEDDDEGHQEAWKLRGTPYSSIALASDDKGHVLWVTGFVRPGQEIVYSRLGDTKQAAVLKPEFAVWNVIVPYKSYRVVARGRSGKASVVTMLTLAAANPNGIFSPSVVPLSHR